MRLPDIRPYRAGDFEAVNAVLEQARVVPGEAEDYEGGLSLVAEDKETGEVVGFVWALAARAPVAYVDYFGVAKRFRGTKAGVVLLSSLALLLREFGIKKIVASVGPENRATLRMLERRGARNLGLHHYVVIGVGSGSDHADDPAAGQHLPTGQPRAIAHR